MPIRAIMMLLVLSGFFPGCSSGLDLTVSFREIAGLEKHDAVVFEGVTIGEVKQIAYGSGGTFLVSLIIHREFAPAATEFSRFAIGTSPGNPEQKVVVMTHDKKGGSLLADGSVVQGETPQPLVDFKPLMDQIRKGFDAFRQDLARVPETEQYKAFERELDELAGKMKSSGQAVQNEIRDTIIPTLRQELEKLKKSLEGLGRQEEIKPLEKKLQAIQDV